MSRVIHFGKCNRFLTEVDNVGDDEFNHIA